MNETCATHRRIDSVVLSVSREVARCYPRDLDALRPSALGIVLVPQLSPADASHLAKTSHRLSPNFTQAIYVKFI